MSIMKVLLIAQYFKRTWDRRLEVTDMKISTEENSKSRIILLSSKFDSLLQIN